MSKEPPREFDPHPGDPWHPEWIKEAEDSEEFPEPESDASWWQQTPGRSDRQLEPGRVPEAYAALEPESPQEVESPAAQPVDAAAIASVARAFEEELDPIPAQVAVAAPVEPASQEPAIHIDLRHSVAADDNPDPAGEPRPERDLELAVESEAVPEPVAEPEPDPEVAHEVAAQPQQDARAGDDVEPPTELAPEPEPEPDPAQIVEQLEARAALAATRGREHAAELALVHRLATAEQLAHEESSMWRAVAAVREAEDSSRAADGPELISREPVDDAWAAQAIAMEEARQGFEESRLKTEAEVRSALDATLQSGAEVASEETLDPDSISSRFRTMAAQLQLADDLEMERHERNEQLRLRTSLLVIDAEQPWEEAGWSRPGSSFGGSVAILTPSRSAAPIPISTTSPATVPESTEKRRWPWSRKRDNPTARSAPQDSLRSVVVIEERSVSGREDEMGDDGQSALPLDDVAPITSADSAGSPDGELEAELAAWADLDWELGDDEADDLTPTSSEPAVTTPPPDNAAELSAADAADWEEFTAEEYVQTATTEYADLAAAVAAAELDEAPVQAAISADMPGLESGLIGLEDVVEAEGMDAAEDAPRSDLALRVVTGLGLVALFFASLVYRWSIGLLVVVVMVVAAGELATILVRQGRHPVALFAYMGTLGALLGTWAYGPVAVPFAAAVSVLVVVMYFGLVAGREDPLVSMSLTLMTVFWIGLIAAFAMDMVDADEYRWLILSLVAVVAVMDTTQYFVGKRFGKRPLAPLVSPKKTVAGLVGGVGAALLVGYGLSFIAPFDAATGLVLGAALAVTGPLGDLAVSVLKRTLGVKDMGTILPGHGGTLDRIDAILFSLPAAWLVFAWAGMLA